MLKLVVLYCGKRRRKQIERSFVEEGRFCHCLVFFFFYFRLPINNIRLRTQSAYSWPRPLAGIWLHGFKICSKSAAFFHRRWSAAKTGKWSDCRRCCRSLFHWMRSSSISSRLVSSAGAPKIARGNAQAMIKQSNVKCGMLNIFLRSSDCSLVDWRESKRRERVDWKWSEIRVTTTTKDKSILLNRDEDEGAEMFIIKKLFACSRSQEETKKREKRRCHEWFLLHFVEIDDVFLSLSSRRSNSMGNKRITENHWEPTARIRSWSQPNDLKGREWERRERRDERQGNDFYIFLFSPPRRFLSFLWCCWWSRVSSSNKISIDSSRLSSSLMEK